MSGLHRHELKTCSLGFQMAVRAGCFGMRHRHATDITPL